jgi:uncharacterized cupin superfamily protein
MLATEALAVPSRGSSNYPSPFAAMMEGRTKRALGDIFGLRNFGVNLTTLEPGARSALHHRHTTQDEFVYVLDGELFIVSSDRETVAGAGMCAGFPAGGDAHHLENRSRRPATYLEVGDRTAGDEVSYPNDDLLAVRHDDGWRFMHRDGSPY